MRPLLIAMFSGWLLAPVAADELDALRQELTDTRAELKELTERIERLSRERASLWTLSAAPPADRERPMVGIVMATTPDRRGVRLAGVTPEGPAAKAGLRSGDLIVSINGEELAGADAVERAYRALEGMAVGDGFEFVFERDGERRSATVTADLHRPAWWYGYSYQFPDGPGDQVFDLRLGEGWAPDVRQFEDRLDLLRDFDGPELRGGGYLWQFGFAWSGLELARINPELARYFGVAEGVLVIESELEQTGLQGGDVIVAIDGVSVTEPKSAMRRLSRYRPGEPIPVTLVREREELKLTLTAPDSGGFSLNWMRD